MLKTVISTMALMSVALTALTGAVQAQRGVCPMPTTKGHCPVVITQSGPYLPSPQDR